MRTKVIPSDEPRRRLRLMAAAGAIALGASLLVGIGAQAQDSSVDISTSSGELGTFLVDDAGMTLYYFEPDSAGVSLCDGDCLAAWPVVEVAEDLSPMGDETVTGTLGVISRDDGARQATYRGRPLYRFISDQAAGDTKGHGVSDVWWIAAEDGSLPNATTPEGPSLTLDAATSELGSVITGADGRTAYFFAIDTTPGVSECADDCLAAWPPVSIEDGDSVAAGEGVPGVIGVVTATDGSAQVTYDGRPLYYYTGDQAAGDANGQGVSGVWWVATVDGLLPQG